MLWLQLPLTFDLRLQLWDWVCSRSSDQPTRLIRLSFCSVWLKISHAWGLFFSRTDERCLARHDHFSRWLCVCFGGNFSRLRKNKSCSSAELITHTKIIKKLNLTTAGVLEFIQILFWLKEKTHSLYFACSHSQVWFTEGSFAFFFILRTLWISFSLTSCQSQARIHEKNVTKTTTSKTKKRKPI